jgi:hypothetical protein
MADTRAKSARIALLSVRFRPDEAARPPGPGSDCQRGGAAGVVRVETAVALGTEQVRGTHATLPQDKVQMCLHALRTSFTDGAESRQVDRLAIIAVVDDDVRVELGQEQAVFGVALTAAGDRMGRWCVAGRRFKGL